jgi:hypothetical protein
MIETAASVSDEVTGTVCLAKCHERAAEPQAVEGFCPLRATFRNAARFLAEMGLTSVREPTLNSPVPARRYRPYQAQSSQPGVRTVLSASGGKPALSPVAGRCRSCGDATHTRQRQSSMPGKPVENTCCQTDSVPVQFVVGGIHVNAIACYVGADSNGPDFPGQLLRIRGATAAQRLAFPAHVVMSPETRLLQNHNQGMPNVPPSNEIRSFRNRVGLNRK